MPAGLLTSVLGLRTCEMRPARMYDVGPDFGIHRKMYCAFTAFNVNPIFGVVQQTLGIQPRPTIQSPQNILFNELPTHYYQPMNEQEARLDTFLHKAGQLIDARRRRAILQKHP